MGNTEQISELCGLLHRVVDLLTQIVNAEELTQNNDGGPGSGNHNHSGVPGQIGGSAPSAKQLSSELEKVWDSDDTIEVEKVIRKSLKSMAIGQSFEYGGLKTVKVGEDEFESDIPFDNKRTIFSLKETANGGPVETDTKLSPYIFLCTEYEGEIKCKDGEMCEPRFISHEEIDNAVDTLFKPFADSVLILFSTLLVDEINSDGGQGSGNHEHKGVPGQIGGSAPSIGGDDENGLTPKEIVEHRMEKAGYSAESLASIKRLLDRHTAGSSDQENADAEIAKHISDGDEIGKALEYKATLEEMEWEKQCKENASTKMRDYKNTVESLENELKPGGAFGGHSKEELVELGMWPEEPNIKEPKFYRKGGMEKDVLSFSTNENGAGMSFLTNGERVSGRSTFLVTAETCSAIPLISSSISSAVFSSQTKLLFLLFPENAAAWLLEFLI